MKPDLNRIHQELSKFLLKTNKVIIDNFNTKLEISYKKSKHSSTSIVTQIDHQVEEMIKNKLAKLLPGSGFIGEETKPQVKEYNWIIDPIDGTLNFASDIPIFATSIGLWHHDQPIYSIVSLPMQGDLIHAFRDQGLYLNGQKFTPFKKNIKRTTLIFSLVGDPKLNQKIYQQIINQTSSPRNFGSCVFHGLLVALQKFNAAILINQAIWDIGAIILLVKEAGLDCQFLTSYPNFSSKNLKEYQHSIIIGPQKLTCELMKKIKPVLSQYEN